MTPANNQTLSSSSGEPSWAAIIPGFRKMPEPITPPMTNMTVVNSPKVATRLRDGGADDGRLVSVLAITLSGTKASRHEEEECRSEKRAEFHESRKYQRQAIG